MKIKKSICFVLAALMVFLVGCGDTNKLIKYDKKTASNTFESKIISENGRYSLEWNDENKCVLYRDLKTGNVWSNIPIEYIEEGGMSQSVNSTLNITVFENMTSNISEIKGYAGVIEDGRIFCKSIKNGLQVTYCFDRFEIAVPVRYVLNEDNISISVNGKNIIESGEKYKLLSVSVSPFLCSVRNDAEDAYLFVPSGSGALMYLDDNVRETRKYSQEVYGMDASRIIQENDTKEEAIRLPVFGVKDGDNALLGIIEEETGLAHIEAEAGNNRTNYSCVYPKFYFRGYDNVTRRNDGSYLTRISETISQHKVTVNFYPLNGEQADYNGMAKCYKKYLLDNNLISEGSNKQKAFAVTMLGGIKTSKLLLGISYNEVDAMTTYLQAKNILNDLADESGYTPDARMIGFGKSGINTSKLAGGFKLSKIFGKKTELNELKDYCDSKGVSLFFDYDILTFGESGSGFSYSSDVAKTALNMKAEKKSLNIPLRDFNDESTVRLLKRSELLNALDKLLVETKKQEISSISFSSLGDISYSDYDEPQYYEKLNMARDVRKVNNIAKSNGYKVASAAANSYAACSSDVIFDVTTENGNYFALDASIPFYQLVFSGVKPMYSEPINLGADINKEVMLAASSGVGLGFTLINSFDVSYKQASNVKLYGTVYSNNKDNIIELIKKYGEYINKISDAEILRYEIINESLSKTVFSNGTELYANHSNKELKCEIGDLEPYGYVFKS